MRELPPLAEKKSKWGGAVNRIIILELLSTRRGQKITRRATQGLFY